MAFATDGSNGRKIISRWSRWNINEMLFPLEKKHQRTLQSHPNRTTTASSSTQLSSIRNHAYSTTFLLANLPLLIAGQTYKASITKYGSGDERGSRNCNTATAACGFYTQPGYSAAISQNVFGVGDGQGAGPACRQCWRLTGSTDSSGHKLSHPKSIVVRINNLCPGDSNVLCSTKTTRDRNQYGAQVHFDLCKDSGAATAFLSPSAVGLAVGTATRVSCREWRGTDHPSKKVSREALEVLEINEE